MELVIKQFSLSTAEEERNYFTGQPAPIVQPDPNAILPPGLYRVIDDRLYRVVEGVAPTVRLSRG